MPRDELTAEDPDAAPDVSREESYSMFLLVVGVIAFALIAAFAVLIDWAWAGLPRIH